MLRLFAAQGGHDRIYIVAHHADVRALLRARGTHSIGEQLTTDPYLEALGPHSSLDSVAPAEFARRGISADSAALRPPEYAEAI